MGGQLDPVGREPVCAQLNSAILGRRAAVFNMQRIFTKIFRVQKSARAAAAGGVRGPHLAAAQADVAQRAGGRRLREHGVPAELAPM